MATKTKRDPLSRYFQDLNESDLDSDESEEETDSKKDLITHVSKDTSKTDIVDKPDNDSDQLKGIKSTPEDLSTASATSSSTNSTTPVKNKPPIKKLPSAHDCLRSDSKPDFLKLNQRQEVNWDVSFKTLEGDDTDSTLMTDYKPNAVPPPSSYEPMTDPGIKVVDSEGRKRKTSGEPEDESSSRKAYRVEKQEL